MIRHIPVADPRQRPGFLSLILGSGLPDQLRRAYEARLAAETDAEKLQAESRIRTLEIAQANRLARAENPLVALAVGIVAIAMCGHAALVAFVSAFPMIGWTVHALPEPMNNWQGAIILGMFGIPAIARMIR